MHYFALSDSTGEHLGFLVMLADDDNNTSQSGQFALKLQATGEQNSALRALVEDNRALYWQLEGERVQLYNSDETYLGHIRQQWLTLNGNLFTLTDLTGAI